MKWRQHWPIRAVDFDRMGVERRVCGSRVSPWRLPFEGDGGRLYFSGNLPLQKRNLSLPTATLTHSCVEVCLFVFGFFLQIRVGLNCVKALEWRGVPRIWISSPLVWRKSESGRERSHFVPTVWEKREWKRGITREESPFLLSVHMLWGKIGPTWEI